MKQKSDCFEETQCCRSYSPEEKQLMVMDGDGSTSALMWFGVTGTRTVSKN